MEITGAWPWVLAGWGGLLGATAAVVALRRHGRVVAALRSTREEQRALADLLDVWHWRSDSTHRLLRCVAPSGPAAAAATPAAGQLLWDAFVPEDGAALRQALEDGRALHDVPVRLAGKPALLRARRCSDAEGGSAGYLGTVRELEAPSTPAAAAAAADAQAEAESFSYSVSHDLRAPVRVVEGFTRILKEDYGRQLDRIGNDHLDRVLGAAARMNAMIDALLSLSRLGMQPIVRQPVDLTRLAQYIAEDLKRGAPARDVLLYIEPGMQCSGDPTLLRIVLENLLGNAWKYTGRAERPEVRFERHAQLPDTFTVSDNGAGFDMRFAERLFGVFQRLHSANDFPGTGIGLATVRKIVRRHGGDIWAEAEVGKGARFHLTLPPAAR